MTQQIERYRAAFSLLWRSSLRNGLIEGEFPGFDVEDEALGSSSPVADPGLFGIARACQPKHDLVLARGGERLCFFGTASSTDAGTKFPFLDWPFAVLATDAEGNWIGLTRDLSSGEPCLCFLESQNGFFPKERPEWGPSFFILTRHFESMPNAVLSAIESGDPLLVPVGRLLEPGRADPRFPPLDVRAELKNKKYLLFLLPAAIEFIETLLVRKPGSDLPLHFMPGLLLVAVHLYGSSSRPRRLRLFVFGFYAGFFAIFAAHVAALWLRGDIPM